MNYLQDNSSTVFNAPGMSNLIMKIYCRLNLEIDN